MENEVMTRIDYAKDYSIKPFMNITIGDPNYLKGGDKRYTASERLVGMEEAGVRSALEHVDAQTEYGPVSYDQWRFVIWSGKDFDKEPFLKKILEAHLSLEGYYPERLDYEKALGCDTSCFYIMVDGKSDTVFLGGDGQYGTEYVYQEGILYVFDLAVPSDVMSAKDADGLMKRLFDVLSERDVNITEL